MLAYIVSGKARKQVAEKLAKVLGIVFIPSSAKASVAGENRGLAAMQLAALVPAFGKFDAIEIELQDNEDTVIAINSADLVNVLKNVNTAFQTMEKVRAELETHEKSYDLVRTVIVRKPAEKGQRGRKASEKSYAVSPDNLFA